MIVVTIGIISVILSVPLPSTELNAIINMAISVGPEIRALKILELNLKQLISQK